MRTKTIKQPVFQNTPIKTAQEIIAILPRKCYGVLPVDQSLIVIKAGELGYWPLKLTPTPEEMMKREGFDNMSDFADHLNFTEGITKAQRAAMEWGSIFGWGHRAADPSHYDENGRPYSEKNPRK